MPTGKTYPENPYKVNLPLQKIHNLRKKMFP